MSSVRRIVLNFNQKNKVIINDLGIQTERENQIFKINPSTSPYDFKYFRKQRKRKLFSR